MERTNVQRGEEGFRTIKTARLRMTIGQNTMPRLVIVII